MVHCWPFSSHNCHKRAVMEIFSTDLLVYRSAINPQGRTFKYGQGGRLLPPHSLTLTSLYTQHQDIASDLELGISFPWVLSTDSSSINSWLGMIYPFNGRKKAKEISNLNSISGRQVHLCAGPYTMQIGS